MKKALIYTLVLAFVLSLTACHKSEPEQPTEPTATPAATSEPVQEPTVSPEPTADTTPEKLTSTTPAASTEPENTQPLEDTTPQEPVEEVQLFTDCNETVYATGTVNLRSSWSAESEKLGSLNKGDSVTRTGISIEGTEAEGWSRIQLSDGRIVYVSNKYLSATKPTTQSSGGGTTQTKPQGQQGQQGQTQQQGQQNQQPTGDISGGGSREDFINNIGQVLDNAGYTPGSKAPLTADEKAGIADAISGRGGQTQGNPSGKTPEQVKAEEEATQKALDDMLNDWLSGN